jgi:tetratricopeptide (TPR) repeat protein
MKTRKIALSLAAAGIVTFGIFSVAPTLAGRGEDVPYFDPLLVGGRICAPGPAGVPPLLKNLLLAQAETTAGPRKAETAPFKPSQRQAGMPTLQAPTLYQDLGGLHFKITTTSKPAQAYFDQGLRLTFAFNHAEAARAFRAAQQLDPQCAMCFWGEALVLGPNINAPMFPDAVAPALAAVQKAQARSATTSDAEQALIAALGKRYSADPKAARGALDKAYADSMAEAAAKFRRDDTLQVLFAESLMDLSPWDYWEAAGAKPKGRTPEIIDALERVLERNPGHAGAIHFYIHTMEASTKPDKALPFARQLGQQMPGAGHIVHMPAHIYYRVGLYKDALDANIAAIGVDEKYFRNSPSDPFYKGAYYPHNVHFVLVSALMGGEGKTALEAGAKLDQVIDRDFLKMAGGLQPVKAAPYFSHVQFSTPDTILALPDPGKDFILVNAMWHYARAVAFARKGAMADSQKEIDQLTMIERDGDFKPVKDFDIPGKEIVQTARAIALGRLADARGDLPAAIKAYEDAVFVQDSLPYTEPPYWYYPVRQSLGAALLRAGRIDEAEKTFRESLAQTPSNGWALKGLVEVYRQRGDAPALKATQKRFDATWLGRKGGPDLSLL